MAQLVWAAILMNFAVGAVFLADFVVRHTRIRYDDVRHTRR